MRILLQTPGHQIQQLRTKPIPLLHVDEVIEHLPAIETLKRMRKHHRVNIHSKEVNIRILLQLIQLFTCVSLQSLL